MLITLILFFNFFKWKRHHFIAFKNKLYICFMNNSQDLYNSLQNGCEIILCHYQHGVQPNIIGSDKAGKLRECGSDQALLEEAGGFRKPLYNSSCFLLEWCFQVALSIGTMK